MSVSVKLCFYILFLLSFFIHTQFFALVDRNRRVRGIYDGLKTAEIEKLIADIESLLKEKVGTARFMNGFGSAPQ